MCHLVTIAPWTPPLPFIDIMSGAPRIRFDVIVNEICAVHQDVLPMNRSALGAAAMVGGNGGATRGDMTICWRIERQRRIERVRGKGSKMRSNVTTSPGKQKANRKWEVEAAH